MKEELQPYKEYKESGLPWLGKIPSHWDVGRNGRLFAQRNETGFGSLPILEVSLRTGVRVRDMENLKRKQVMSDREKYKRALTGDIAYNMMRMWQGAVGVAPVEGLISPAYVVAQPFEGTDSRYFSYLFRTEAYKGEIDGYSRGIVKDRNRLYWEDFKRIPSCIPPFEEQKKISKFLNANAIQSAKFIKNRQRLLKILNERKKVIIDRAVNNGIVDNIPIRPVNLNYTKEIPKHWETRRLRYIADIRFSNVDKHTKENENPVRLCNYTDVYKNNLITNDLPFMKATATLEEIENNCLNVGDVLITKDSEDWLDIGIPALVKETADDLICGYHLAVLCPKQEIIQGAFLYYFLQCQSVITQFSISAKGVTRYGLSQESIKSLNIVIPPLDEQKIIVSHIENSTFLINRMIASIKREIDLIREYRNRLILDVATGKLDVTSFETDISVNEIDHDVLALNQNEELDEDLEISDHEETENEID